MFRKIKHAVWILWRILTFPIWFPWLVVRKTGFKIWSVAKALWTAIRWTVRTVWRVVKFIWRWFGVKPVTFVFRTAPRWFWRVFIRPPLRGARFLNTWVAYWIHAFLERVFIPRQNEAQSYADPDPEPPALETQEPAFCHSCGSETRHRFERISETSHEALLTCTVCSTRSAGQWQDTPMMLESYA